MEKSPSRILRIFSKQGADPYFHEGDYGENEDGDDKRALLQDGVKDVYELVSTAL